ncbi:MAG: hypothetical protein AB7D28_11415 [Candidatus Berkiella sp.]
MLFLPSSSSSSSDAHRIDLHTYFIFWDMDDTSVKSCDNQVKNPHLLLPIKLFQSAAPNQQLGIMTNRAPSDLETDYTVNEYLALLRSFGIFILDEHVIFGGGTNAEQRNKEYHQLELAVDFIGKQIDALKLTEIGTELAQTHAILETSLFAKIEAAKYHGKNHQLVEFLNRHYNEITQSFTFGSVHCSKKELIYGIVDDLATIAAETRILGDGFLGIQASPGGNPPSADRPVGDYYKDDYLFEVAEKIGLSQYATELLIGDCAVDHGEPAMMKIAALLYAWHAFPDKIELRDFKIFEKILNVDELECIAKMLEYVSKFANIHQDAHYRDVSELAACFRHWADTAFLAWAPGRLVAIKREKFVLQGHFVPETFSKNDGEGEDTIVRAKKKNWASGFLSRTKTTKVMRSSPQLTLSATSSSDISSSPEFEKCKKLGEEQQEILERQQRITERRSQESQEYLSSSSSVSVATPTSAWLRTTPTTSSLITPTFARSSVSGKRNTSLGSDYNPSGDDGLSRPEEKDDDSSPHQRNSSGSNTF